MPTSITSNPSMKDPCSTLPRTVDLLEAGIRDGAQIGAQVFVSIAGKPLADFGLGEDAPGVAIARLADGLVLDDQGRHRGRRRPAVGTRQLELDDPVARFIPEFGKNGKERVTIRHVLTHTGGFPAPMQASPSPVPSTR